MILIVSLAALGVIAVLALDSFGMWPEDAATPQAEKARAKAEPSKSLEEKVVVTSRESIRSKKISKTAVSDPAK